MKVEVEHLNVEVDENSQRSAAAWRRITPTHCRRVDAEIKAPERNSWQTERHTHLMTVKCYFIHCYFHFNLKHVEKIYLKLQLKD